MHLCLRVAWHGARESHPVGVTAQPGSSGAEVSRELTAQLGAGHAATVDGVPLELTRVGRPPLVDGATVVLNPTASPQERGQTARPPEAHGAPEARGAREVQEPVAAHAIRGDLARLTVVEGAGVGWHAALPRDVSHLEAHDGALRLVPVTAPPTAAGSRSPGSAPGAASGAAASATVGSGPGVTLVMDASGLRTRPRRPGRRGVRLEHGDRLRVVDGQHESWVRVEFTRSGPGGGPATSPWPQPSRSAPGPRAEDSDPARPLRLETVGRRTGRIALVTGLLPLVVGVGVALATGWWFFLLFSALGAVTSLAGWFSERGARREHGRQLAAGLARDLRRCRAAAPSSAEIVRWCETLGGGGQGVARCEAVSAPPAQHGTTPVRGGHGSVELRCWLRLGHGPRPAGITRERGTAHHQLVHRHAPVLLDLAGVRVLCLDLPREQLAGILDSAVLQLFTGPRALHRLEVSPGIPWAPPVEHAAWHAGDGPVADPAHRTLCPEISVLQVLTAQDAACSAQGPEVLRIVVGASGSVTAHAVLTHHAGRHRLTSGADAAVPGLCTAEQREHLEFLADSLAPGAAARALGAWRHAAGESTTGASRLLPRVLGTHQLAARALAARTGQHGEPPASTGTVPARPSTTPPDRPGAAFAVSRAGVEHVRLDDENPHLLVAGTTGCGKSEVLRTLVVGLAAASAPGALEFVLLDFKGGAALAPLTGLPHVTTLLTDLGPDEVKRALAFLRSELTRRERVLARHGLQDMAQALRHAAAEPVIRELVVVVDEAKMLTDAFPEASHQLAVIAAVGRSLGVHLVLATQRPQGALGPDVRANITQALCLRVRTEQESTDVLGTPVAAHLPAVPGRGYLHRGEGAPVAVQCAVTTRMVAPEPRSTRVRFLSSAPSGAAGGFPAEASSCGARSGSPGAEEDSTGVVPGGAVDAAVGDVVAIWQALEAPDPGAMAVPPALPLASDPVAAPPGHVDLGPAENPAEHWCGRATWRPWEDGPLMLVGRPPAVRDAFQSIVRRCATDSSATLTVSSTSAASTAPAVSLVPTSSVVSASQSLSADPAEVAGPGVSVYVVSASGTSLTGLVTGDGHPLHGAVRGWARADQPADLAHLLSALRDGLQAIPADGQGPVPRALLAVEDWDRCCQVLRTGAWAHLEDELLALVAGSATRNLSTVVTGDRALVAGRSAQLGASRLWFPAGQAPDALLQWPRLPPMTPHPGRGALAGAAASRCAPPGAPSSAERTVVVQVAEGPTAHGAADSAAGRSVSSPDSGGTVSPGQSYPGLDPGTGPGAVSESSGRGALPSPPASGTPSSPDRFFLDHTPWPRSFPLPTVWRVEDRDRAGLLLGVSRDGEELVHPWGPWATLVVTGPARSGRTVFLDGVCARLGAQVIRAAPGTAAEVLDLVRAASAAAGPVTLVIDDADALPQDALRALGSAWEPLPSRPATHRAAGERGTPASGGVPAAHGTPSHLGSLLPQDSSARAGQRLSAGTRARRDGSGPHLQPGPRLVLSVRMHDGLTSAFPPLLPWRHRADALLLQPRRTFDGDLFGAALSGQSLGGPPGRGFWVHRGLTDPLQTPAPPASGAWGEQIPQRQSEESLRLDGDRRT